MLVAASTPASEYRQRLDSIVAQRHAAVCCGTSAANLTALDRQVSACRESYIGAAVTEIATLRALLDGPNHG
jgi:hypothetical protein